MNYILYNPKSGNKENPNRKELLQKELGLEEATPLSVLELDFNKFLASLTKDDKVYICGGDGTINKACNILYGKELICPIYYHANGTGNDFANDVKNEMENGLFYLNDHVKSLPRVLVNGEQLRFVNGIGFGIDGEACRVADEKTAKGATEVNYTSISINLLLFHYKKPKATVEIDGKTYQFKNVWLAASMKGKYYGGGMMVAPKQNRYNDELTFVCIHRRSRLGTLIAFPSLFKGEHVNKKGFATTLTGKHIKVTFSHPTSLQVDGETKLNVTSYEVFVD